MESTLASAGVLFMPSFCVAFLFLSLTIQVTGCEMFRGFKRFWHDQITTPNGDIDPARVWGYLIIGSGGMLYNYFEYYTVVVKGQPFDPNAYADGLIKVGTALLAAAAGIWIKHGAEVPYNPEIAAANMPDDPGVQAAVDDTVQGTQMTLDGMSNLAQDEIAQAQSLTDKLKQLWRSVKNIFK